MATTIQLKIKDKDGNIKTKNHEIDEITLDQYIGMMQVLNDALKTVNGNKGLLQLIDFFNAKVDDNEDVAKEEIFSLLMQSLIHLKHSPSNCQNTQ